MTLDQPQVGVQLVFDEQNNEWFVSSTGHSLAPSVIHTEIRSHATLSSTLFDNITVQMYAGEMDIALWQNAVFAELKDGHTANAIFANGGGPLSPEAITRLESTIAKEAKYLADFADGVSNGTVSELQARARARQYSQAMEQSYWNEWKADIANTPDLSHLPLLTNSPGDGQTQCRGNCQCLLEVTEMGINWVLNPAEHCDDCLALAAGSPYRSE